MIKICTICGSNNFKIKSDKFCSQKCIHIYGNIKRTNKKILCEICDKEIRYNSYKKHLNKHKKDEKILNSIFKCEYCNKEFYGKLYNTNRFCCKKCARGFSTKAKRKEINEKVNEKNNEKRIIRAQNKIIKTKEKIKIISNKEFEKECLGCKKIFVTKNFNRKYCSQSCSSHFAQLGSHHIIKDTSRMGGLRPGGGKSKQISYINWLGYKMSLNKEEIEVAKILDEKQINWKRNTKGFPYITENGKKRKYYPDFVINDNKYIEYKGWITKEMEWKMSKAKEKNNLDLIIIIGRDKRYLNKGISLNELKILGM
jgi:hypothetical protein